MPRELTNLEVESFLQRHPDVQTSVEAVEAGGVAQLPIAYPGAGVAVQDPSGRYVLVWRDATRHWHFIDLADMTLMNTIAAQVNNPPFVSDPDYLGAIRDAVFGPSGLGSGGLIDILALAAVLVVGVVVWDVIR